MSGKRACYTKTGISHPELWKRMIELRTLLFKLQVLHEEQWDHWLKLHNIYIYPPRERLRLSTERRTVVQYEITRHT